MLALVICLRWQPGFSTLTVFPFVLNEYHVERYIETISIFDIIIPLPLNFSIHWWFLPKKNYDSDCQMVIFYSIISLYLLVRIYCEEELCLSSYFLLFFFFLYSLVFVRTHRFTFYSMRYNPLPPFFNFVLNFPYLAYESPFNLAVLFLVI